jgi:hypothetical protein
MMLFQVGISSFLIFTRMAYYSYSVITTGTVKNDYQAALDTFFSQLTTQLFYLNYAKSFYVYTLFSKYFRKIFLERIMKFYSGLNPGSMTNLNSRQQNLNRTTNKNLQTTSI